MTPLNSPALRGVLLALLAVAHFGISMPLMQRLVIGLGAFSTAALLYGGAAFGGVCHKRLLALAAFGALIGPVALAFEPFMGAAFYFFLGDL